MPRTDQVCQGRIRYAKKHFHFLLEGRSFTLFTDHKPLTFALFRVSPPWSARQQRHLSYLSEFTSDLVHLPGHQKVVADALSGPFSVLSPAAFASLSVDMVQDSGLTPLGEFLPRSAPSFVAPPCCFTHPFTIMDSTSHWPETVPQSSNLAEDCARALISCWILRFVVPAKMTSDCGAQFTSSLLVVLCSLLKISFSKTTSFHSHSNGLVECFHRSLKTSLLAGLAGSN